MKIKERQPNNRGRKCIKFITFPIRMLGKAKDFYVRGLLDYANSGHASYGGGGMGIPAGNFTSMQLPRSFSVNSSRSEESDLDYGELMRVASVRRSAGNQYDFLLTQQEKEKEEESSRKKMQGLTKSCSVAAGGKGMGRIDEDGPCDFGGQVESFLYPRSRSYAVAKPNLAVF